jgi:hypothetical protein
VTGLKRLAPIGSAALAALGMGPAEAEAPPRWMLTANGGSLSQDGDATQAYGGVALTRRLGTAAYVRASVTRFGSAVRQFGTVLPSTYTLGFLSAGTTFGRWFVDGYGALGRQDHRHAEASPDARPMAVPGSSAVLGTGGDVGWLRRFDRNWSLAPSASVQFFRFRTLHGAPPDAPGPFETRDTGTTFGGMLRLDRWLGPDRTSDIGLHVARFQATNASAALVSGARGGRLPDDGTSRGSEGWTEVGGNATAKLTPRLYLDGAASRTVGAASGDVTATSLGFRYLF